MTGRGSTQGDNAELLAREKNEFGSCMIGALGHNKDGGLVFVLDFDFDILASSKKHERKDCFLEAVG